MKFGTAAEFFRRENMMLTARIKELYERDSQYKILITALLALLILFAGCMNDVRTEDHLIERSTLNSNDTVPVVDPNELEMLTFIAVNDEREQNGFARLKWNDRVAEVARLHSRDMAEKDYFDHVDGFGYNVDGRLRIAGLRSHVVGENIVINETQVTYRSGREVSRVNSYKEMKTMVETAVQGLRHRGGKPVRLVLYHPELCG